MINLSVSNGTPCQEDALPWALDGRGWLVLPTYRGADKSLARPTSRYILFDGENISFDA